MTLRQLVRIHGNYMLEKWDHTAQILCQLHNQTVLHYNLNVDKGKPRLPMRDVFDFHPYRHKNRKKGMVLTPSNIGSLKTIAKRLVSQ